MPKPNIKEIEWAISELEGKESSERRYQLLAALYTCRNEMLGLAYAQPQLAAYSEAAAPEREPPDRYGDSDGLQLVYGKEPQAAWSVMDELMETLRVVNPRAYDSVMRKLGRL